VKSVKRVNWDHLRRYAQRADADGTTDRDRGDTLIEVIIALLVVSIMAAATFVAFAGLSNLSGIVHNQAVFETQLKNVANAITSQIQDPPSVLYATCATSDQYNTGGTNAIGWAPANLPSNYTVSVTSVKYWNGTSFQTSCPIPTSTPGQQLISYSVTNTKTAKSESTSVVVDNPYAPPYYPPDYLAKQLVFTQQPTTTYVDDPITPAITVAVKDGAGSTLVNDWTGMTLTITAGTGTAGAVLSTCTGTEYSGVFTFPNCSIDPVGNGYTLTATDSSFTVVSTAFNIVPVVVPGAPTNVTATSGSTSTVAWTAPIDNGGRPITSYADGHRPPQLLVSERWDTEWLTVHQDVRRDLIANVHV
jgi:prepilin-type N-terminal cleavage/methylation domain-containing protein